MTARVIEVDGITLSRGGKRLLSGLSLAISPGELVAVVGANGCGKSTLGRVLCAAQLIEDGSCTVDGYDPARDPSERLIVRALVGRVCQDPLSQVVSASVFDEVAFGPRNLGLDEDAVRDRVLSALGAVGMSSYADRVTTQLSGGELQRIAIAGVLAMAPRYLVLDEPTAQLDPRTRDDFRALFLRLAHEEEMGIVLITHDRQEIDVADRVIDLSGMMGEPRSSPHIPKGRPSARPGSHVEALARGDEKTNPVLSLRGVGYSYGSIPVLRDVTLSLQSGEVVMLTGPSGAGKSTLGLIASGMLPPDVGEVKLGQDEPRPGDIGIAFQRPEGQFFLDSVFDEIAFGLRNLGWDDDEVDRGVRRALVDVGLDEALLGTSPFALSGGQARRVALASVLALNAPVYVLDEPTAALDEAGRDFIHDLVCRMAGRGHAVLVITHDLEEWRPFATRELLLRDGVLTPSPAVPGQGGCRGSSPHKDPIASGAFGGYVAGSLASGVDARVKMALLVLFTIGVFVAGGPFPLAAWFALLCVCSSCARMGIAAVLRGLRPVCLVLAFAFAANALSVDGGGSMGIAGPIGLDLEGGLRGARAVGRIALVVGFSLVVASSTTAAQLSDGCVRMLGPLARFGLPVGAIGTALSLTLRFIPLINDEIHRIKIAQSARGAQFDTGALLNRIRAWMSILTPLIIGLLRRADLLAEAMSARCYDAFSAGRRPTPKPLTALDVSVLAAGVLLFGGLVAMSQQGGSLW